MSTDSEFGLFCVVIGLVGYFIICAGAVLSSEYSPLLLVFSMPLGFSLWGYCAYLVFKK